MNSVYTVSIRCRDGNRRNVSAILPPELDRFGNLVVYPTTGGQVTYNRNTWSSFGSTINEKDS